MASRTEIRMIDLSYPDFGLHIPNEWKKISTIKLIKIKDIVDRDTYEKLADTGFSKDKQFLYLLKEWSDRWELHIISKEPNKYKLVWRNCRYYLYSDGKYYLNQDVFTEEELKE